MSEEIGGQVLDGPPSVAALEVCSLADFMLLRFIWQLRNRRHDYKKEECTYWARRTAKDALEI